jgi:putative membrane protein
MTDRPGFIDELAAKPSTENPPSDTKLPPSGPMMLEGTIAVEAGKIDVGWNPEAIRVRRKGSTPLGWIGLGLAGLIGSWGVVSLVDFVVGQFYRSQVLGWVTVGMFVVSGGLLAFGLSREAMAWRSLRHVDALNGMLGRKDIPIEELRAEVLRWLTDIRGSLKNAGGTVEAVSKAAINIEIMAILEKQVTAPMEQAALRAGAQAAVEASALVAMIPSPALEGAIAGIRSLLLVRQIARIYGIRPGLVATVMLLQRIAWTVATVAGTDLLAHKVLETTLHKLPYVKDLMSSFPEVSLTAIRLYRLAAATAVACSPTGRRR